MSMTVRFNPPPGWPAPPATWVPHDEWLPDPDWPAPPGDWSFWAAAAAQSRPEKPTTNGVRLSKVSFPVATAAAQSTVSLAALFPDRARRPVAATYGGYGRSAREAPVYVPGGARKGLADRHHHESRGRAGHPGRPGSAAGSPEASVPSGSARHGSVLQGSVLNGSETPVPGAGMVVGTIDESGVGSEIPLDPTTRPEAVPTVGPEPVVPSGIRLSPVLQLVAHPSGLRVQFRVGGPVAAALAELLTPAVEAATAAWSAMRPGDDAGAGSGRAGRGGRGHRESTDGREGGLRRLLRGRRAPDSRRSDAPGSDGPGRDEHPTPPGALSIRDLARRSMAARRAGDRSEIAAVERELCSLHLRSFAVIRQPVAAPPVAVTPAEAAEIRQKALESTGANAKGLTRAESADLKALAADRAEAFIAATDVARRVVADRRAALTAEAWRLLVANDAAAVVAVVDEAMRLCGSDITCLDAGTDPVTHRAYVTVLLRFETIDLVGEESREVTRSGKTAWRARTPWERNGVYAAGLASTVLAAAKQVASVAIASDDLNVVVVRPAHDGRGVEPIYVGVLDREDVSLRHPDADPLPLIIGSAVPHGIRIDGPDREVTALHQTADQAVDLAADPDGALREIVEACRAAEASGGGESLLAPGEGQGEG